MTGPQYEPKSAVALPAETEPNNVDVPYADLERQNAGAAGCEDDPNRRLVSNAVLLWRRFWCSSAPVSWRMPPAGRLGLTAKSRACGCVQRHADPSRERGDCRSAPASARPILTRRASEGISSSHSARAGSISTRRASSDVAPLGRRPEGAVTNQPRATPWDHAKQPRPCPERAKQNAVFHVRLRHRNSRELWRPYRACASLESRFPGRCPGLKCCFPFGAEFQITQHRNAASRGLPFPVPSARGSTPTGRASEGISGPLRVAGSIPTRRASSDVAPLGRRPEGAVTNQPRATPWDHAKQPRPCPERAKQNAVFHVRLRHRNSRELWRPYRACASLESRFPGRCPGLACRFPFGAEFRE